MLQIIISVITDRMHVQPLNLSFHDGKHIIRPTTVIGSFASPSTYLICLADRPTMPVEVTTPQWSFPVLNDRSKGEIGFAPFRVCSLHCTAVQNIDFSQAVWMSPQSPNRFVNHGAQVFAQHRAPQSG